MAKQGRPRKSGGGRSTRERLLRAAAVEFGLHGFGGTDSNKIARRAGFAPQTFYRWFRDKSEIFLAVYRQWEDEEANVIGALAERRAKADEMAGAIVAHHRSYLLFRRSLRALTVENDAVRAERAQSRLRQLQRLAEWNGRALPPDRLAPLLLQIERLSDAIAEGELADLGVSATAATAALAGLLKQIRQK